MLTVVIAEAELELVPEEAWNERCVMESARKRGKNPSDILLDSSYHHGASVCQNSRRGRPDIVHITLQLLQESLLNISGKMRIFVHTRDDHLITINPETRLPKNYGRFCGLIEKLFREGNIKSGENELLKIDKVRIDEFLSRMEGEKILLHPGGAPLSEKIPVDDMIVIIGGFPQGDFMGSYEGTERFRVADVELTAWAAAMEAFCWYKTVK